MAKKPRFVSNKRKMIKLHEKISKEMLRAAAIVVQNQAKRNVRGGFKSGDFVTGELMRSITHRLEWDARRAVVGTTKKYGAFWELGHHNAFTRKYEREPWLGPALRRTKDKQQKAANKAAKKAAKKFGIPAIFLGLK